MRGYAPILLLLLISIATPPLVWGLARLLRPKSANVNKHMVFVFSITPTTEARAKFSVRYYLVAVMFLIFDVETVFLMPWAIQIKELALFGLVEMLFFLFLLLFGYGYIWAKGALTWE